MIRKIAGFKYAVFGLFSVALISVACSDEEDAVPNGGAGTAGKASGAGSGGEAPTAGSNSSGAATGGTNGGTAAGGGTAGTGAAGNAGTAAVGGAGADAGGAGGVGGEGGMPMGGEGGALSGGAGGEGGAPFVADVLDNPGFEVGTGTNITGWTNEGTTGAAYIESASAHSGQNKLSHWTAWSQGAPDYTARTYQTVSPIANGTYSFSMWVNRDWETVQYLYARGFNANDLSEEKKIDTIDTDGAGYVKVTLTGIPVTSGTCTVGIYTASPAGSFANIDDAEFVLE